MNSLAHATRPAHAPHFPVRTRATTTTPAAHPASTGSWRYQAAPRRRWTYTAGLLLSVGLHTVIFFGFQPDAAPKPVAAQAQEQVIAMEMPAITPEEPEPTVSELPEAPAQTVAVPQLVEVPSLVALNDFQQLVDLRPQTAIDPNALRQLAIPVNHGRGSSLSNGLSNVFRLSDLDRAPQAVAQPAPNYPPNARSAAEEEVVVLNFIVDADGVVREPRAVRSTNRDFESAAVNGVLRWKFKPGMKGGRKVATLMEIPLKFVVVDSLNAS